MVLTDIWHSADLPRSIHGTAVSVHGRGALIVGPAGSGKSSLALQLLALGAGLISDDLTWLDLCADGLQVSRPPQSSTGVQIEARGLGLLTATPAPAAPLHLVVDMSETETRRLPEARHHIIATHPIRTFRRVDNPAFPAMVLQYLKSEQG